MSKAKRKYTGRCIRFVKSLNMPIRNVLSVMPDGFTAHDFVLEFKVIYPYFWIDICEMSKDYRRRDNILKKKNLPRRYNFPAPETWLIGVIRSRIRNKMFCENLRLPPQERTAFRKELIEKGKEKLASREKKLKKRMETKQNITPSWTNYYIKTYFDVKKKRPLDVDTRFAVLYEASKYKSPITIKFLYKVNASERNYYLREFAFRALQNFGEKNIFLRKNRKGKKRAGDKVVPIKIETPDELINFIYKSEIEHMKTYDLFLSHSCKDREELLKLKIILNHSNINIYVDWVNDVGALKRELANVNTARAIIERMNESKALLFVFTESSFESKWTLWELGYFHAKKGKICVYNPDGLEMTEYFEIYPKAILRDGSFYVECNAQEIPINQWIENGNK